MTWLKNLGANKWVRWSLQFVLVVLPLGLVFQSLITNWQTMRDYTWDINMTTLILSFVVLLGSFALLPLASQRIFSGLGCSVNYRTAYYGYFVSQLAKYLPGGLWIVPGRAWVLKDFGVNPIYSSVGMIIETCGLLIAGVVVFMPYLLFSSGVQFVGAGYIVGGVVMLMLAALHPRVFNPLMRWVQARLGYEDFTVNLTWQQLALTLLFDLVFLATDWGGFCIVGA